MEIQIDLSAMQDMYKNYIKLVNKIIELFYSTLQHRTPLVPDSPPRTIFRRNFRPSLCWKKLRQLVRLFIFFITSLKAQSAKNQSPIARCRKGYFRFQSPCRSDTRLLRVKNCGWGLNMSLGFSVLIFKVFPWHPFQKIHLL